MTLKFPAPWCNTRYLKGIPDTSVGLLRTDVHFLSIISCPFAMWFFSPSPLDCMVVRQRVLRCGHCRSDIEGAGLQVVLTGFG